MRLPHVPKRNGFTLIELLVVIAIIAILMALTLGVMSKVFTYLDETKVSSEVARLTESCNLFKAQYGRYPASKIILAEQGVVYQSIINGLVAPPTGYTLAQYQALAAYSVEYLSSIFPGINLAAGLHDWNGNGIAGENGSVIIEGDQCLVFFLGGMRYGTNTPIGFNVDKTNPTAQTNGARTGPFFEFETARLTTTAAFPSYKDPYGTPYAYFASKYPGMNNYPNRYVPNVAGLLGPNDCETLTSPVAGVVFFVPYFQGTVPALAPASWPVATSFKFCKGDTFQIISAGKDKQFGTGGQYNQTDPEQSLFIPASLVPAITQDMLQANYDNITNVTNGRVVPK